MSKQIKLTIKEQELIDFKKRRYVNKICAKAIASGEIVKKLRCELCCGRKGGIEAHHVDYGKPLEIIWLCQVCHGKVHRKGHMLNPANNKQTPLPQIIKEYNQITISFTLPVQNFIAIQREAERKKKPIGHLMKNLALKNFPVQSNQLEFNFYEDKNDSAQYVNDEGIQNMAQNDRCNHKPKRALLQKIRRKRDNSMPRMETRFYAVS